MHCWHLVIDVVIVNVCFSLSLVSKAQSLSIMLNPYVCNYEACLNYEKRHKWRLIKRRVWDRTRKIRKPTCFYFCKWIRWKQDDPPKVSRKLGNRVTWIKTDCAVAIRHLVINHEMLPLMRQMHLNDGETRKRAMADIFWFKTLR